MKINILNQILKSKDMKREYITTIVILANGSTSFLYDSEETIEKRIIKEFGGHPRQTMMTSDRNNSNGFIKAGYSDDGKRAFSIICIDLEE